jgi:hypothetical protein
MLKSDNTGVTTPATSNPSGNSAPPVQSSKTDPNNAYQPLDQTVSGEDEEIDPTCLQSAFEAQGYTWDKKFNFFGIRRLPADGRRTNSWTDLLGIWMLDDQGNETELMGRGRHDPCVLPRAVPIVEAMSALVLIDQRMRHHAQCRSFSFQS